MEIVSNTHVKFCYDLDDTSRQQKSSGYATENYRAIEDNFGCAVAPNENGWVDISEPIIRSLTFSDSDGAIFADMPELEKIIPGTVKRRAVSRRRFNLFAMTIY